MNASLSTLSTSSCDHNIALEKYNPVRSINTVNTDQYVNGLCSRRKKRVKPKGKKSNDGIIVLLADYTSPDCQISNT